MHHSSDSTAFTASHVAAAVQSDLQHTLFVVAFALLLDRGESTGSDRQNRTGHDALHENAEPVTRI